MKNPFSVLLDSVNPFTKAGSSPNLTQSQLVQYQLFDILSGVQDSLFLVDKNKGITLANKAALNLSGSELDQVVGRQFGQVIKLYSSSQDVTDTIFANDVVTKEDLRLVLTGKKPDGKQIIVKVGSSPIQNHQGNVGWVITLHDATIESQFEAMKTNFVSVAAHELRTPLTSIKGYLSVFMGDYKDKLNADQQDLLNHVVGNTERLLVLIENLLNVSRIERGAMNFNPEGLDYVPLVHQIVDDFTERAAEKNIQLKFTDPASAIPKINADKVRLGEVLSNLISNAISYTPPNGIVKVWVEIVGNEVVTHVADNGKGIPQDAIGHLFTKFYRITDGLTQDANSQGNGLGLYISKSIIDMHHGRIWVESEVGKGSRFSFSIPLT